MIIDNIVDVLIGNNGYMWESIGKFVADIANIVRNYCVLLRENMMRETICGIDFVKEIIERVNYKIMNINNKLKTQ